jgi:dephospho-CoA kinase
MTLVLGITGGIAAGKSSVAAMFAELGAVAVSADQLAREAVAPGSATLQELSATFGPAIVDGDGALDREALAQRVFDDPAARARLNAITHPAIARLAEARLHQLRASGVPLVVYEAPLLFEAGAASRVDLVLTVTVDPQVQQQRLTAREHRSPTENRARIDAQWPQAEKVVHADFVIDNSGSLAETQRMVTALYRYLLAVPGH